jgi:hypothetical protein
MRKYTTKIIEMVDEGMLDRDILIRDLLCWMSEADVEEFYDRNLTDFDKEDEEDELDINEEDDDEVFHCGKV